MARRRLIRRMPEASNCAGPGPPTKPQTAHQRVARLELNTAAAVPAAGRPPPPSGMPEHSPPIADRAVIEKRPARASSGGQPVVGLAKSRGGRTGAPRSSRWRYDIDLRPVAPQNGAPIGRRDAASVAALAPRAQDEPRGPSTLPRRAADTESPAPQGRGRRARPLARPCASRSPVQINPPGCDGRFNARTSQRSRSLVPPRALQQEAVGQSSASRPRSAQRRGATSRRADRPARRSSRCSPRRRRAATPLSVGARRSRSRPVGALGLSQFCVGAHAAHGTTAPLGRSRSRAARLRPCASRTCERRVSVGARRRS